MIDPTATSSGSIMPAYPWLAEDKLNTSNIEDKINTLRTLGVPYPKGYEKQALADLNAQADKIVASLKADKIETTKDKEIVALIAYLQRLGTDIKK
jgi:cytochrome c oxidase cbb3-type subunit I/II